VTRSVPACPVIVIDAMLAWQASDSVNAIAALPTRCQPLLLDIWRWFGEIPIAIARSQGLVDVQLPLRPAHAQPIGTSLLPQFGHGRFRIVGRFTRP
jgi:hypothetical protein